MEEITAKSIALQFVSKEPIQDTMIGGRIYEDENGDWFKAQISYNGLVKMIEDYGKRQAQIEKTRCMDLVNSYESKHDYRGSMHENRFSKKVVPMLRQLWQDMGAKTE